MTEPSPTAVASPHGGQPIGVLVMAYGTPARFEDVESFYTDVRRGRPPSPEQLADLRRRYEAIGGISQLNARTDEQLAGIQAALDAKAPGRFRCRYGAKHADPKIESAVSALAAEGSHRLVGLVLAPHYSAGSVGEYIGRAGAASEAAGVEARFVEDWHDRPELVSLLAERVRAALATLPGGRVELLVSAHSLPVRLVEGGDGYDERLAETARLVAAAVPTEAFRVCWQSAGRTPEPWLGPDVLEVLRQLAHEGFDGAVVCPAGFVSDHLEINYDLDIEARRLAGALGLAFARTESLNADERLCRMLAELVEEKAEGW
jgi:ferrochelatase